MSVNIYDPSTGQLKRVDKGTEFTGATSSAAGKSGIVPAPAAGKQNALLKGDGTWDSLLDDLGLSIVNGEVCQTYTTT